MIAKRISVEVSEETWRACRLRMVHDGMSFQSLGRVWFDTYGLGGTVTASTELTIAPRGLAAGEPKENEPLVQAVVDAAGSTTPSPAARPCSQAFKHHINHTGRPCKECGYPTKQEGGNDG